ncbi:MAG: bifunctional riboflavin kinase/FAD synthetase [Bacteroidales bacterium]|nr:bifunctional riboflavin kinase/FAD synthetase [Bacteroidales bacterium]
MFQLYDINGPIDAIREDTAITVGVFDGVHRGHQHLLSQLPSFSSHLSPLVVTLTAHPSFVLGRRDSEYWLDDPEEHLRLLFEAGVKYVAVLPFTKEVAQMTACEMAQTLYELLHMRRLLIGYDSRFGNREHDDFDRLPQLATELGFTLQKGEPFLIDGHPISSSRIRNTLTEGRVEDTATLLGRPYSISGTVQHGRGVGHTLGFPTANISLDSTRKMLPKEGVYFVKVKGDELNVKGMANLGSIPTFDIDKPSLEVHLIDFASNLYGETVTVEFHHRLRDIVRFNNAEELQQQLQEDFNTCHRYE